MTHARLPVERIRIELKKELLPMLNCPKDRRSSIVKYLFNLHLNISYMQYEIFT